jgi:hypothetical protein
MKKGIIRLGSRVLPAGIKSTIRKRGSTLVNQMDANQLASTSKRLDVCAAQVAHVFHLAGFEDKFPLRDKTCVEMGSGWVLSHSLILHLLGAKKVIATDIQNMASPASLRVSIDSSTISLIRDILSPFEEHRYIKERLNKICRIEKFSFETLNELGIEYVAPVDLAQDSLKFKADFIYSNSVLEHVPVADIIPLLKNLEKDLAVGGYMIHCIHLEDHKDFANAPFAFLSEPEDKYTREIQTGRGNRLRRSQWTSILSGISGVDFKYIYEWSCHDGKLPENIDSSIHYIDEEDLRYSHLGVLGVKNK